MSNTVRQISYFRDVDMFQNIGQIKKLTQDLYGLCGLMRKMVENGKKFLSNKSSSGAEFNISQNDIYYTNNIFIVNNINTNYVFSSFDNPNYIFSKDIRIYQKTLSWIKNMDRHCISLSKSNEIVRSKFFHLLQQSIEEIEL